MTQISMTGKNSTKRAVRVFTTSSLELRKKTYGLGPNVVCRFCIMVQQYMSKQSKTDIDWFSPFAIDLITICVASILSIRNL
jgi:hypothetical protein